MGPFLPAGPSLVKQGLKTSGSVLRHQTTFLGGQKFSTLVHLFMLFYTQNVFQQCKNHVIQSLYAEVMPPIIWPSCFHIYSSGGCHVNPHYSWKRG